MGASYFIVLDKPEIDAFVNGKAIARESKRLSRIAKSIGISSVDEFISFSDEDIEAMAEDFGVDNESAVSSEQWFIPDEGLAWVSAIREHINMNPKSVKDIEGVLSDLNEYEQAFKIAKDASARWHLSVDY